MGPSQKKHNEKKLPPTATQILYQTSSPRQKLATLRLRTRFGALESALSGSGPRLANSARARAQNRRTATPRSTTISQLHGHVRRATNDPRINTTIGFQTLIITISERGTTQGDSGDCDAVLCEGPGDGRNTALCTQALVEPRTAALRRRPRGTKAVLVQSQTAIACRRVRCRLTQLEEFSSMSNAASTRPSC